LLVNLSGHHYIIGTAGHIDHGKTALVKALTGVETDTHAEEKKRGITINLGFTHVTLPGGIEAGVVDVPGHHDFIRTMVAGASGVDLCMLVISAEEGVKPQTKEHLAILNSLGVQSGIAVITKTDLVENDLIELVNEEIKELVAGTFLDRAQVVPVSVVSGNGIDELKKKLSSALEKVKPRSQQGNFQLFPDRVFSITGFGTVVTGSVKKGKLNSGEHLNLFPGGRDIRVRRMERHGKETEQILGGDRASLNLLGVEKEEIHRGNLLYTGQLEGSDFFDAELHLFKEAPPAVRWNSVNLLWETADTQARVHLLGGERLDPEETGVVQIHIEHRLPIQWGDAFIIRDTSNRQTLGGGRVLDPFPLHHKRATEKVKKHLEMLARYDLKNMMLFLAQDSATGISLRGLAARLNLAPVEIENQIIVGDPKGLAIIGAGADRFLFPENAETKLKESVLAALARHHRKNPLSETGIALEAWKSLLGIKEGGGIRLLGRLLAKWVSEGLLKKRGSTWALKEHRASVSAKQQPQIDWVLSFFKSAGIQAPLPIDLLKGAKREGIHDQELKKILEFLSDRGDLVKVGDTHLDGGLVAEVRNRLLVWADTLDDGFRVSDFRDLISGNRKICLLLLEIFDQEELLVREGDLRKLAKRN